MRAQRQGGGANPGAAGVQAAQGPAQRGRGGSSGAEARAAGSGQCGKEIGGAKIEGREARNTTSAQGIGRELAATAGRAEKGQPGAPGKFWRLAKPESRAKCPGGRSRDCGACPRPRLRLGCRST